MIPISGFDSFKRYLFKNDKADIDSWHFKLHYRVTFTIFTVATILTSAKAYFSKSITCSHSTKHASDLIETFCWINSTFSVTEDDGPVPFYGLSTSADRTRDIYTHSYYQWLPYFFCLQAVSFYIPYLIWKLVEGGKISGLTTNIRGFKLDVKDKVHSTGRYIAENRDYLMSKRAFGIYLFCEWLNLLNMLLQCRLLNTFLNVDLIKYDMKFGEFFDSNSETAILLKQTFPTFGKCLFKDYGPSGDIQVTDVLCLLPINMFNEKIFLILWFYLSILAVLTFFGLLLVTLRVFGLKFLPGLHEKWLKYVDSLSPREITIVNDMTEFIRIEEYFLFYLMEKNLTRRNYIELVETFNFVAVEDKAKPSFRSDRDGDSSQKTHPAYDYDI